MPARVASRYVTVGETTYAPGEEIPSEVVDLIDNPAVWEGLEAGEDDLLGPESTTDPEEESDPAGEDSGVELDTESPAVEMAEDLVPAAAVVRKPTRASSK